MMRPMAPLPTDARHNDPCPSDFTDTVHVEEEVDGTDCKGGKGDDGLGVVDEDEEDDDDDVNVDKKEVEDKGFKVVEASVLRRFINE